MDEKLYLHALSSVPGVGATILRELLGTFGSAEEAWAASPEDWQRLPGIGPKLTASFAAVRSEFDFAKTEEVLTKENISLVSFLDQEFPKLLEEIPNPPALLYLRGSETAWEGPLIAIVGSRKYTSYGQHVATTLSRELAEAGFGIVSGLAFGIDAFAHEGTLDAHGKTIAVLGSGIDDASITPSSHRTLAHHIIESSGALLSEYAPGTPATAGTFPARNRIVAGLTLGTLVIEAPEESGSLITARLALDFNREVFAVPGSILSISSQGTNTLLKEGARVVTSVQDILEVLAPALAKTHTTLPEKLPDDLSEEEQTILKLLTEETLHVDKIIENTTLETMRVSSILTKLEMRGLIKHLGNLHYIRIH